MRKIFNKTPFATGETLSQNPVTGEPVWYVATKATFDINVGGSLSVAEEQVEVYSSPVFEEEDPTKALLYESDLLPKPKIDLLLNATCYAPKDVSTNQLDVNVVVGNWSKTLRVFGKRRWLASMGILSKSNPMNFDEIPITYERAFGGEDPNSNPENLSFEKRNTIGVGFVKGFGKKTSTLDGQILPNIEYPAFPTKGNFKKNRIAGFGPIPGHWEPRIYYTGTYDEAWQKSRFPLLPLDFDPFFYQCAPEDQILEDIQGGETIILENMTMPDSLLKFSLPKVNIGFQTLMDGEYLEHTGKLNTIIIEPDFPRLTMVWMTQLACKHQGKTIEFTRVTHEMEGVQINQDHHQKDRPVEIENMALV